MYVWYPEFVIKRVTVCQKMGKLLWILVFLCLEWSGKINGEVQTTSEFQSVFQPTTSKNKLEHSMEPGLSETMSNNFSSPAYNDLYVPSNSTRNLTFTVSSEIFPNATTFGSYSKTINYTSEQTEDWTNIDCSESTTGCGDTAMQSHSSIEHSKNFNEHVTAASVFHEGEIENSSNDTSISEYLNGENISTPPTFLGNASTKFSPHAMENLTSLEPSVSTQNPLQNYIFNIRNISSISFKSLSSSAFPTSPTIYGLDQSSTVTEIPQMNTEEYLQETNAAVYTSLNNIDTSQNSSDAIKNIIHSESTTDITETYPTYFEASTEVYTEETTMFTPLPQTLATTYNGNSTESFIEMTSGSSTSNNHTSNHADETNSTAANFNIFNNISMQNNKFTKQEIFINHTTTMANSTGNDSLIIPTLPTVVATQENQQKEGNHFSLVFRNNGSEEKINISSTTPSSDAAILSRNSSEDFISMTLPEIPRNEEASQAVPVNLMPTVITTQGHLQKDFLFKHVNNLTDTQRNSLTVDIIFTSAVDIVEWFHSYDSVFRTSIASLLTEANVDQPIQSINIVYIAPTPLRSEKYFCVTFIVESTLNRSEYEFGETVVQKIKLNVSELAEMLQLPVESVMAGYNETSKCHKSSIPMQEKNWNMTIILSSISLVSIVVILVMCIQKSRNGKHFGEIQIWNSSIQSGTGRYRSTHQLSTDVQNLPRDTGEMMSKENMQNSSKEENNPFIPSNGLENVLIHNEEKYCSETSYGECNDNYVEDTKL